MKNKVWVILAVLLAAVVAFFVLRTKSIIGNKNGLKVTITGLPARQDREIRLVMVDVQATISPARDEFYVSLRIKGPGTGKTTAWPFEQGQSQEIPLWTAIEQYESLPAGLYQVQAKYGLEITEEGWANIGKTITLY
jgi:hypothetical protein